MTSWIFIVEKVKLLELTGINCINNPIRIPPLFSNMYGGFVCYIKVCTVYPKPLRLSCLVISVPYRPKFWVIYANSSSSLWLENLPMILEAEKSRLYQCRKLDRQREPSGSLWTSLCSPLLLDKIEQTKQLESHKTCDFNVISRKHEFLRWL